MTRHPSQYQPDTPTSQLLHTLGIVAIVVVVLPLSLARQHLRAGLTRLSGGGW